jgi:hypothetical protein
VNGLYEGIVIYEGHYKNNNKWYQEIREYENGIWLKYPSTGEHPYLDNNTLLDIIKLPNDY